MRPDLVGTQLVRLQPEVPPVVQIDASKDDRLPPQHKREVHSVGQRSVGMHESLVERAARLHAVPQPAPEKNRPRWRQQPEADRAIAVDGAEAGLHEKDGPVEPGIRVDEVEVAADVRPPHSRVEIVAADFAEQLKIAADEALVHEPVETDRVVPLDGAPFLGRQRVEGCT